MKTLAFSRAMCAVAVFALISGAHGAQASDTTGTLGDATVEPGASLAVTQVDTLSSSAAADDTYADGWKWLFHITVPVNETQLQMKFADWTDGTNTVAVANNMRFYSAQSSDAADEAHAVAITSADAYGDALTLAPDEDLDTDTAGRQVEVYVESKIPTSAVVGTYGTNYGVDTEVYVAPPVDPVIVEGSDMSTNLTYNSQTPSSSYGTFTLKFDVTAGNDDIYIPKGIASTTAASSTYSGVTINEDMAAAVGSGVTAASLTSTADSANTNFYVIHAGDTETFTATVTVNPLADGDYEVGLDSIKYSLDDVDLNSLETFDVNQNDDAFHTDPLHIPNS
jgi:hypothetical protein